VPTEVSNPEQLRVLLTAEQIQNRVRELAAQISHDYRGKTVTAVAVLENGFMFMSDLVRQLQVPVLCHFIKPQLNQKPRGTSSATEIFFSPQIEVRGQQVLLVEGLVQSGVTSDFLLQNIRARGAASVKLATFLDKSSARRVALQPDYFGFILDESYVVGYGLGAPQLGRNLPYIAATNHVSEGAEAET
jgi:hypoxanthine phosphoribosyltransferase